MKKPTAYLHTLDNTEGIEGNEPQRELSFSSDSPFGVPGVDHSKEFSVQSTPLYSAAGQVGWVLTEILTKLEPDESIQFSNPARALRCVLKKGKEESSHWEVELNISLRAIHEFQGTDYDIVTYEIHKALKILRENVEKHTYRYAILTIG